MNNRVGTLIALLALLLTLAACGGGGEEPPHPPTISNLKYSPATALQAPGGTAPISGTFDFADAGGDITSLRITSSGGVDLTVATPALSSIKSGTGTGTFTVSVDTIGRYTFELWAVDSRGSASNRLSGTFEVLPDDAANTWTRLEVLPPAVLYGVAWDGRQYVAVGARGTVMTSQDLSRWTVQASGVDHTLRSVAASPSRFVAVGDNGSEAVVLGSTDGASWSVHYRAGGLSPMRMLSKVIWTGSQFVAVGQEIFLSVSPIWVPHALILTSPDGVAWTQRARGRIELGDWAPSESAMSSVAWSGDLLVAVGIYASRSAAWTSPDAENWTRRDMPGAPAFKHNLRDVTWGNGQFVAVGWGGTPAVFTSADGFSWQGNSGSEPLPAMNAVTTGVSRYLAVSNTFRETSVDGTTWTVFPSTDCGNGVLWDGTRYVSVGVSICRSP